MGNNKNGSANGTIKNYKAEIYATTLTNADQTNVAKISAEIERLLSIKQEILNEKLLEKLTTLSEEYGALCYKSVKGTSDFRASDLRKKAKELNEMQEKVIKHSELVSLIDHLVSQLRDRLSYNKINSPFNKRRTLKESLKNNVKPVYESCPESE